MRHHPFHRHGRFPEEFFGPAQCFGAGRGRGGPHMGFFRRHGRHGHHHGGPSGHHFMGRLLAHGDLRTVVLLLIEEQARHGYELIKLIEEKSSGQYAPSPGVIYPTLTYLEETGFVKTKEENGKKQYSITAEGKEFLDANRELAESILERLEQIGAERAKAEVEGKEPLGRGQHAEVRSAFHALRNALRNSSGKAAKRKKEILAVLEKARAEIEALLKEGE